MTPNTDLQQDNLENHFNISPRDFDKRIFEHLDRRYYTILLISIVVHLSVVFYFVSNPYSGEMSQKDIEKIQKRFADLVLDRQQEQEELTFSDLTTPAEQAGVAEAETSGEQAASEGSGTLPAPTSKKTAEEPAAASDAGGSGANEPAASTAPRRTREQIRNEVKAQGLLGLLSSSSGKAAGEEVNDVLGEGGTGSQINEKLANISGTQRPGAEKAGAGTGGEIRGERETEGGGDALKVGDLGKSSAGNTVSRSGDLQVQETKPLIELEEGEILQGARDQDAVAAVVHSHNSAIQYCYQRELKRDPDLRGKLVVRFKITPQGTVNGTTILSSTLNNASVEKCIVSRINRWNDFGAIDPSKGDTTIRQVYTFGY